MTRWPGRVLVASRDERGVTLTETAVAGLVGAVLVGMMISWFGAITAIDGQQRDDDLAMEGLRDARALLGRELRSAQYLLVADADALSMWLDEDRDGVFDDGEAVTWSITGSGSLQRGTDLETSRVIASPLVVASSGFTYDASDPALVTRVEFEFVVRPDPDSGDRHIGSQVLIRNSRLGEGP